jgi:hypothetical protein
MNEIASFLIIVAFFIIGAGAATFGMAKKLEQSHYMTREEKSLFTPKDADR